MDAIEEKTSNRKEIPKGFGKNVNDYLNHNITVADAKAVAILAANFLLFECWNDINCCSSTQTLFLISIIFQVFPFYFVHLCFFLDFPKLNKV